METDTWRRVDATMVKQLYSAFMSDGIAPFCVRAVENRLLSTGILFTSRDYSIVSSDEFQAHVNQFFVKFVRDALVQLNICGWCAFIISDSVPQCVPLGVADVRWRLNQEKLSIDLVAFKNEEPNENVFFIIDTPVDSQGTIVSNMSSYLRTRSIYDAFVRNVLVADSLNARPPIYTMSQTDAVFDERDIASASELPEVREHQIGNDMKARTKLSLSTHRYNELLVKQMNAGIGEASRKERVDPQTGLQNFDVDMSDIPQPVYPLPLDSRIAQAPRPNSRADIVSVMKHFENLACIAFGVNSESVGADTRSGGHAGAQTLERVNVLTNETTMRWARLFETVLVNIYNLVWREASDQEITVVFPSTLPSHMIERLFTSRVLSYDAYINYISNIIQMPKASFERDDHRFLEERKPPKPGELGNFRHV